MEKIRIKDIAERAGVSVGTVDRVLYPQSRRQRVHIGSPCV
ncbi:LacI family DNA-binding transcriptional regulator, partial [Prevotella merdae]